MKRYVVIVASVAGLLLSSAGPVAADGGSGQIGFGGTRATLATFVLPRAVPNQSYRAQVDTRCKHLGYEWRCSGDDICCFSNNVRFCCHRDAQCGYQPQDWTIECEKIGF
jgi:hypothetical protein